MEKLIEPMVETAITTATSSLNPKVIAKIKSYMQRELFTQAKPETIGKTQTTQVTDAQSLSIFDGSIYVEPKGRSYYTTGEKLLSEHVRLFFEQGAKCRGMSKPLNKKVCVILGDPGSGKTTFGKHFMKAAFLHWEKNPSHIPIPLWIPLSRLKLSLDRDRQQIYSSLLTYLFKERIGLKMEVIQTLQNQAFHIFLDSYDEINYVGNLYDDNQWSQWPRAQFVVATRPEKFRSQPHSLDECLVKYFAPSGNRQQEMNVYTISSLDESLIQEFIAQWVMRRKNTQVAWKKERFWQAIAATPNIKLLAANPVMLTMLLYALPELDKEYAGKNKVERFRLEQLAIYDKFVSVWFSQQAKRIEQQLNDYPKLQKLFRETQRESNGFSIESCLRSYTENLAYRCLLDSPDEKLGIEITTQKTLLAELLSHVPGAQKFLKNLSTRKTDDDESYVTVWMKLLRSGCLLRCDTDYFAFFHKSLVEYFTQQHLFNDACLDPTLLSLEKAVYEAAQAQGQQTTQSAALNGKLLVKEHNLISMLAKRALRDMTFRDKLYNLVSRSCHDAHFSCAASNAITILKNAHQPLNHPERNWRGLRIPGADLSYAILEQVQWQGGDLRGVNFYGAFLKEANFSDARLLGCQWPTPDKLDAFTFLKFPIPVTCVVYTWDGDLVIMGDERGKIALYSTKTYQCVHLLRQYSVYNFSFNYRVSALAVDGGVTHRKSSLLASAAGVETLNYNVTFSALRQGEILLWKLPSGKYLGKLAGHKNGIDDLQLTTDGEKLISHGIDGSVYIWNVQRRTLIQQIKANKEYFSTIRFEMVMKKPVTLLSQTIYVTTELSYPKIIGKCYFKGFYGHIQKATVILFDKEIKDVKIVFAKSIKLKEKIIKQIGYREYLCTSVALSPSGRYVVFVQANGQLNVYGSTKANPFLRQKTPQATTDYLKCVKYLFFSPDERYLAACGSDEKIVLWSIETNEDPAILPVSGKPKQLIFSTNGDYIAVRSSKTIEWINRRHTTSNILYKNDKPLYKFCMALSIDASQIALTSDDGVVLCSIASDFFSKQKRSDFLQGSYLSPQGRYIVSFIANKMALFSAETGVQDQATDIEGHFLGFSTDEMYFYYRKKETVYKYSLENGKKEYLNTLTTPIDTCLPNGTYGIKINKDDTINYSSIELCAIDSSLRNRVLNGHEPSYSIQLWFSPNGEYIASTSFDKTVCIWSVVDGQRQAHFTKHRGITGANRRMDEPNLLVSAVHIVGDLISLVDVPSCAAFTRDNSLLASASGGFSSYSVFIYTIQGIIQQKLVDIGSPSLVSAVAFNATGEYLAVLKVSYPLSVELHLWNWKKSHCFQRISIIQGTAAGHYISLFQDTDEQESMSLVWHNNHIRILCSKTRQCLDYYKGKNDAEYRLSGVIGNISPNLKKLSIQGTRGLTAELHHLLKAQGVRGNPKAFAYIVNDEEDARLEKKELAFLKRCRKNLIFQRKQDYSCPALFEPQKHINCDRWQMVLFRIMKSSHQSKGNKVNTSQASTSGGAIDYHVYGFIEGLDATGRSMMIQFDLVEDRYCQQYARVKNKCMISESRDVQARRQAFMSLFNREKTLPTQLCLRIAGTLSGQQRDQLLDTIISEQQRQFESQDMWEERRIRYQQTGGRKTNLVKDYFSANCLTWLCHILRPYKLNLPHSSMDNVAVNPKHTLSASSFFRKTSNKVCDVSDWDKSTDTLKQIFK